MLAVLAYGESDAVRTEQAVHSASFDSLLQNLNLLLVSSSLFRFGHLVFLYMKW